MRTLPAISIAILLTGTLIAFFVLSPPSVGNEICDDPLNKNVESNAPKYLKNQTPQRLQKYQKNYITKGIKLRIAAFAGDQDAFWKLGDYYYEGHRSNPEYRILPDYAMSCRWYAKAAERGSIRGQIGVGRIYHFIGKNYLKADYWYRQAIENAGSIPLNALNQDIGHSRKANKAEGAREDQKLKESRELQASLRRLQNAGRDAQFNIGLLYAEGGHGIEQSYVEAKTHYILSGFPYPGNMDGIDDDGNFTFTAISTSDSRPLMNAATARFDLGTQRIDIESFLKNLPGFAGLAFAEYSTQGYGSYLEERAPVSPYRVVYSYKTQDGGGFELWAIFDAQDQLIAPFGVGSIKIPPNR